MKPTGVTRKIDELGRVVIPKEIRKNLGIRDGENLEIFIEQDRIILKKHNYIYDYQQTVDKLCDTFYNTVDIDILITDREKIVSASNMYRGLLNKKLNNNLLNMIDNREYYSSNVKESIKINNIEIEGYFTIEPIISSTDSLGLIILINKENNDNKKMAKLIARILSEKIDIN